MHMWALQSLQSPYRAAVAVELTSQHSLRPEFILSERRSDNEHRIPKEIGSEPTQPERALSITPGDGLVTRCQHEPDSTAGMAHAASPAMCYQTQGVRHLGWAIQEGDEVVMFYLLAARRGDGEFTPRALSP